MSAGITFTRTSGGVDLGRLRDVSAFLPGGNYITVCASTYGTMHGRSVDLGIHGDMQHARMLFTVEQARAVAVELLACADAHDAAQGEG